MGNQVLGRVALNKWIWTRATAKAALGFASLVLPEHWLDSPQAVELRGWMWDPPRRDADGSVTLGPIWPEPLTSDGWVEYLVPPSQHLVAFWPLPDPSSVVFKMVLFGLQRAGMLLDLADAPVPAVAWVLDPGRHSYRRTTPAAILLDAAQRKFEDEGDEEEPETETATGF